MFNSIKFARRLTSLLLFVAVFIMAIPAGMTVSAAQVEQNIISPKTNGDVRTVGNIMISPNITTGEFYMEAKVKPIATDYTFELFKVRHNQGGAYGTYTPVIVKFSSGKVYARNNYNAEAAVKVGGQDFTYTANTWYVVKVKVTMGGQWGPAYDVWINGTQVVWGYVVTGGTGFTNLGRADFTAGADTPFEYIKIYRLVDDSVPAVFLNKPVPNQSFLYGEDVISLAADASIDGGTITKVEFYDGVNLIATDTAAPYTYDWANAAVGTHSLTAKAYAGDVSAVSPAVSIKVAAANPRPAVHITSPANNSLFAPDSMVTITADTTDDGGVSKIEFFMDTVKLGEKTAPTIGNTYSWTIAEIPAGSHMITAVATDNLGMTGAGQSIQIEAGTTALVTETFYEYNFNDYTAPLGTTAPKQFGAYVSGDGKMTGVPAPDRSAWGNCIKLFSGFGVQMTMPVPNPSTGIIVAEGDFRFEGYGARRTLFHPRYEAGAGSIAQVLSASGKEFVTKGGDFVERTTGYRLAENQWYHIRSIIDLNNHTYAIEVDGETLVRMSTISYGALFNAVYLFGITQDAGDAWIYIDNLKIGRMAPPTVDVSITTPYNNQIIQSGTSFALSAKASTTDGSVNKVEYYNGGALIGSATTAPYSVMWNNVPAGVLNVTAKAYTTTGVSGGSNVARLHSRTVVVPSVFASNMVLQQNAPIKVWGTGIEGAAVSVLFNGEEKNCVVTGGKWIVSFSPIAADNTTQYTMTVSDTLGFSEQYTGIMMGEVWVCAGQSNMERTMYADGDYATELADANDPHIRFFTQEANPQPQPQLDVKNGKWSVCSSSTLGTLSAVGYYFGKQIHLTQNVPVGLISASVGGTQAAQWMSAGAISANPKIRSYYTGTSGQTGNRLQSGLYNGMISPLMPFSVQGVIWYQGESDANVGAQYDEILATMIRSWRDGWNDQNIDFHLVQLVNYNDAFAGNRWDLVRQSQYHVTKMLDKVGLAVCIDLGDSNDIHPLYKKQVGYRLSLSARKLTYGENIEVYQGPVCSSVTANGNKLILDFEHKGAGLKTSDGNAPLSFEIRGADGVYYPAAAAIADNKIELVSTSVSAPVAVRYAQKNDPPVNLYNSADLPAMPFTELLAGSGRIEVVPGGFVFKNSTGGVVSGPVANGSVGFEVTVKNHSTALTNAVLILQVEGENKLINVACKQEDAILVGTDRTITASLTLPADITDTTIKAYVWDSLWGMRPLSDVFTN